MTFVFFFTKPCCLITLQREHESCCPCIDMRSEEEALLMFWDVIELGLAMFFLLPGAVDLAATSAGIIPGSPLPVLDPEGLSGISPLSSDEATAALSGQDSTSTHQNGDPIPAMGVSV